MWVCWGNVNNMNYFTKKDITATEPILTPGVKSVSCRNVKNALRFADEEDGFPVGV